MKALRTFVAILLCTPCVLFAGVNQWTSSGPATGSILHVYASPRDAKTAFAWTTAGLYKTIDAGENWSSLSIGLPQTAVEAFTVAPDGTLYAAFAGTVYLSGDSGAHWFKRGSPGDAFITDLVFDPGSNHLIAGVAADPTLFVSGDRGTTWKQSQITNASYWTVNGTRSFAVSATAVYSIVATNQTWSLFRSADGGEHWSVVNVPVTVGGVYADVSSSRVYVTTMATSTLMVSKDEAASWTTDLPVPSAISAAVPFGNSIIVSTSAGVFVYDDGAPTSRVIGSIPLHDLAVSSETPRRFYGTPQNGVVTYAEGDTDWRAADEGLPAVAAADVALSQLEPSIAYATTDAGVFRTDDGGRSWTDLSRPLPLIPSGWEPYPNGSAIAVSGANPNTAYVSGGSGSSTGVFKTDDAGTTWKKVAPNFGFAVASSSSDPKTLYGVFSGGLSKSTNGGETWSVVHSDLAMDYMDFYYGGFWASSIAVDPSSSSNVLLGRFSGIFKTSDGGSHWSFLSSLSDVRSLTIDPASSSTLYAAPNRNGIIKSEDGGATWKDIGLADKLVTTIAVGGSSLFAGTADGHIYRSGDKGASWSGFDDGGTFLRVSRIASDSSGSHLYAATASGVYTYDAIDRNVVPQRLSDDPLRLQRLLNGVLNAGTTKGVLIVPVAGTVRGGNGTLFTTQLTLTDARQAAQSLVITRLPFNGESPIESFTLNMPVDGTLKFTDIAEGLETDGLGALLITAVDDAGNFEPNASINASTRIWSFAENGLAPTSQFIPSGDAASFVPHTHLRVSGGEQDAHSHTNAGIVNLSADAHQFTIQITGERAAGQFTIEVPAFSLVHVALPPGDYGQLTIDGFADAPDTRWLLYGSTIDETTGQGETTLGSAP